MKTSPLKLIKTYYDVIGDLPTFILRDNIIQLFASTYKLNPSDLNQLKLLITLDKVNKHQDYIKHGDNCTILKSYNRLSECTEIHSIYK